MCSLFTASTISHRIISFESKVASRRRLSPLGFPYILIRSRHFMRGYLCHGAKWPECELADMVRWEFFIHSFSTTITAVFTHSTRSDTERRPCQSFGRSICFLSDKTNFRCWICFHVCTSRDRRYFADFRQLNASVTPAAKSTFATHRWLVASTIDDLY